MGRNKKHRQKSVLENDRISLMFWLTTKILADSRDFSGLFDSYFTYPNQ